jgi:hypothetical protein
MPRAKRRSHEADCDESTNSPSTAEPAKPKPTPPKKRKIGKRELRQKWVNENAPDISIPEEFKSNPNLQYMDLARLFFSDSKLEEWATKVNEFAHVNPDKVNSSIPIDDDEPEFSDTEMEEEYECDKNNYPDNYWPDQTPDQGQAPREWVEVSPAEMEIFLGTGLAPEDVHC